MCKPRFPSWDITFLPSHWTSWSLLPFISFVCWWSLSCFYFDSFPLRKLNVGPLKAGGEGGHLICVTKPQHRLLKTLWISECLKLFWPSFKQLFCYVSAHSIWWCCGNKLYHFGNKISERKRWRVEGLLNIKFDYECLACSWSLFCL